MTRISKSPENDITPDEDPDITGKRQAIKIREMEIDDLAVVFHLGETLFKSSEFPGLIISSATAQFCSFRWPYLLDLRKGDSQKLADVMIKPEFPNLYRTSK